MATRFEELKQKGWKNLNGEERAEFQSLKPAEETMPEPFDANTERIKKLEDLVAGLTKDKSELKQEVAKLQSGWEEYVPPAQRNKMATIKLYRENTDEQFAVITKAVVFKNNDWNEETHKYDKLVYTITLRHDDGSTKEIKLDAMRLAEIGEVEKVEIVKEDRRTLRKVDGYVTVPDRDREGYPKRILGGGGGYGAAIGSTQVPLEVFTVKSTVVVKRKNGQEISMDADFLNL